MTEEYFWKIWLSIQKYLFLLKIIQNDNSLGLIFCWAMISCYSRKKWSIKNSRMIFWKAYIPTNTDLKKIIFSHDKIYCLSLELWLFDSIWHCVFFIFTEKTGQMNLIWSSESLYHIKQADGSKFSTIILLLFTFISNHDMEEKASENETNDCFRPTFRIACST